MEKKKQQIAFGMGSTRAILFGNTARHTSSMWIWLCSFPEHLYGNREWMTEGNIDQPTTYPARARLISSCRSDKEMGDGVKPHLHPTGH